MFCTQCLGCSSAG